MEGADPGKVLLLLPSASWSARANWDLQVEEESVMDAFAERGWFVIALEFPGYRGEAEGFPGTARACADLLTMLVPGFLDLTGEKQLDVLGWSWGAQVAGLFAQENPHLVRRLVLYGFTPSERIPEAALAAAGIDLDEPTRVQTREAALSDFEPEYRSSAVAQAYADAALKDNPTSPNGPLLDFARHLPLVDPKRLTLRTQVISGWWDVHPRRGRTEFTEHCECGSPREIALQEFCEQLPEGDGLPILLRDGGHAVHLEEGGDAWLAAVVEFLERP